MFILSFRHLCLSIVNRMLNTLRFEVCCRVSCADSVMKIEIGRYQ